MPICEMNPYVLVVICDLSTLRDNLSEELPHFIFPLNMETLQRDIVKHIT